MNPTRSWWTSALLVAGVLALVGVPVLAWWRTQQTDPTRPVAAGPSRPGWEIRYNAAVALAQRGSDLVKDRLDLFAEMLDEERQRANFSKKEEDGRTVVDEAGASGTVRTALQAVALLRRKNPTVDLSELHGPVEKLLQSPNAVVRLQAEQTWNTLTQK